MLIRKILKMLGESNSDLTVCMSARCKLSLAEYVESLGTKVRYINFSSHQKVLSYL